MFVAVCKLRGYPKRVCLVLDLGTGDDSGKVLVRWHDTGATQYVPADKVKRLT